MHLILSYTIASNASVGLNRLLTKCWYIALKEQKALNALTFSHPIATATPSSTVFPIPLSSNKGRKGKQAFYPLNLDWGALIDSNKM